MKTIVGLFDDISDARNVVNDLISRGFDRNDISLVARNFDATDEVAIEVDEADEIVEGAAVGAVSGGLVGGMAGLLVGLGAFAIPGVGPIVAAGPIVATLTGAGIGAAAGGVFGALVGWGLPDQEAEYYVEGVRRGGTLVAVKADEMRVDDAVAIMESHSPVDIERRSAYWRETGWEGFNPTGELYDRNDYELEQTNYKKYGSGSKTYKTYVPAFERHFDSIYGDTDYSFEQYEPGYRYGYKLAMNEDYREHDDWDGLEAEAREEWQEAENVIGRTWDEIKDSARFAWEQVKGIFQEEYNSYSPKFQNHFRMNYENGGHYSYDDYEPAYRYGYRLANDERFHGYDNWDGLEAEAREEWNEAEHAAGRAWDDVKGAVRHAWEIVTEPFDDDAGHTHR